MRLFTKIYVVVLVLFTVVVSFIALQVSRRHIAETERLLINKHRITGSLVTSEIQRWHAEGKWPFEALKDLTGEEDFLFWWIIADDDRIYLADKVEYVGTDSSAYFPEMQEGLRSAAKKDKIVLNRRQDYGVFAETFTVGNERWAFRLGFSTRAIHAETDRILLSTLAYSIVGLAVLGFALFFAVRRFLGPLRDLSEGAKRIGRGDLDYRVSSTGRDEIGIVAEAFDRMADNLQKDIVERIRVQKELAAAFERFKTVMDSVDALIYVADMETYELLFVNKYVRDFWGDITGKVCWQTLQAGQSGPCAFCTNPKIVDADGNFTGTYVWEFQNTVTNEWYECRDRAIHWTDSRPARMEIATNITQRKLSETALAEEKERLAVTLRSIGDGVITTDIEGRVVLVNKVAERLTGWRSDEAVGRPLEDVFHIVNEKNREIRENPVAKVLASGQIVGLANHTVLVARDGRERSIADSGAPILDTRSNTIGVVLVFRDVTEQIRTEKELLKMEKLESIGVLAGGIAHDFNNILTAILGNVNLALFDPRLEGKTREILAQAERATLRARDLTRQLLTFSKGGEPVRETASLESVIRDSANFVLHGDKVACRFEIPEDLWLVDIDKGQIGQVIQNIVLNASHAMPGGGIVTVACENVPSAGPEAPPHGGNGRFVKISITDTGIGMPANMVERIFDPYFTTKQEGSGLGLAVSQSIVTKHNGRISVTSSPGAGTTFTIYLPASAKTTTGEQAAVAASRTSSRLRVLVMDDEETVRALAGEMLALLGHEAVLSKDGEDALSLYRTARDGGNPFDLAILDLTIPGGMGGEETVHKILGLDPDARVVVSSGYSNDPIMAHYKDHGFCAAILKPYRVQDLSEVIGRLVH